MKALGYLALAVIFSMLYAFVTLKLWLWFVVPLGVVTITFAEAWGIHVLVSFFLLWGIWTDEEKSAQNIRRAVAKAVMAAILFLEGWIVHLFATGAF